MFYKLKIVHSSSIRALCLDAQLIHVLTQFVYVDAHVAQGSEVLHYFLSICSRDDEKKQSAPWTVCSA